MNELKKITIASHTLFFYDDSVEHGRLRSIERCMSKLDHDILNWIKERNISFNKEFEYTTKMSGTLLTCNIVLEITAAQLVEYILKFDHVG